jgi:hypothetical protein
MAKRSIRKTDPETTSTPERRHAAPVEPTDRAAAPKTTRSRRKSDAPVPAVAPPAPSAAPSHITAEAAIDSPSSEVTVTREDQTASPSFTTVAEVAAVELSHDQIAERAYHLYLERGRQPGDPFADWLTAERELRRRFVGA